MTFYCCNIHKRAEPKRPSPRYIFCHLNMTTRFVTTSSEVWSQWCSYCNGLVTPIRGVTLSEWKCLAKLQPASSPPGFLRFPHLPPTIMRTNWKASSYLQHYNFWCYWSHLCIVEGGSGHPSDRLLCNFNTLHIWTWQKEVDIFELALIRIKNVTLPGISNMTSNNSFSIIPLNPRAPVFLLMANLEISARASWWHNL